MQMKSCQLVGGSLRLIETEVPEIGRGDVLVNMKACGICGTDVEKVLGHYASNVLGHEAVGILEKVGRDVDGFSEGDRVFPHHHVPCYTCHYCRNGSETMCPHFSASNLIPGGLSEYFILPEWNVSHGGLFRIPSSIDFRRGTLIEPMACVLRAIGKVKQNVDLTWLVVGAGPVGMLHVLALHLLEKGNVVCVEPDEERRRFSKRLGAMEALEPETAGQTVMSLTEGRGADVAIVATGSVKAIESAARMLRKGGMLIQFGLPNPRSFLNIDMNELFRKEISIVNTYSGIEKDVREAIALLEKAPSVTDEIISHSFTLENAIDAFGLAMKPDGARKIIIENR